MEWLKTFDDASQDLIILIKDYDSKDGVKDETQELSEQIKMKMEMGGNGNSGRTHPEGGDYCAKNLGTPLPMTRQNQTSHPSHT